MLNLRIVVERPPAGVDYALQKGRGNGYETVQKQRSSGGDLAFEFSVSWKGGPGGTFVQASRANDLFIWTSVPPRAKWTVAGPGG